MKKLFSFSAVLALFASAFAGAAHAADGCVASVKEGARSAPKTKAFEGVDTEIEFAGYGFGILVDGTSTYLTIRKPDGEQISTFFITPPDGAPATNLSILGEDGSEITLRCRI